MPRTLGLKGVDLSHYQKTTAAGVIQRASDGEVVGHLTEFSFGVAKATHGPAQNSAWAMHSANIRKAGLVLGAYHWLTDADPISAQAAKFLEVAKDADFLVVDQEESGVSDAEAQQFIDLVRAAGRPCGLYHSASGFGGVSADFQWVADYRALSVAAGYPRRTSDGAEFPGWDIWQWTSKGGDEGEGLDKNWLNPATPLAKLLRLGYVTKASADAQKAVLDGIIRGYADKVAVLEAKVSEAILERDAAVTRADLATAVEKERIAMAAGVQEADRIRGL